MAEGSRREASSTTITELLAKQRAASGAGLSICPTQVAKSLAAKDGAPDDWRRNLALVRQTAVALAKDGRIAITRKGKPVDPDSFKGVYRLALPAADEEPDGDAEA